MIKANELRIGNYVAYPKWNRHEEVDRIFTVKAVSKDDDNIYLTDCRVSTRLELSIIKPIILTDEILLKCGFVKIGNEFHFWEASVFNIENINGFWHICYVDGVLSTHVKYLHQLQNFYHSIMDKELEINL